MNTNSINHRAHDLTKSIAAVVEQSSVTSVVYPGKRAVAINGERTGSWKGPAILSRGIRTQAEIRSQHVYARLWTIFESGTNVAMKADGGDSTEGSGAKNVGTGCRFTSWNADGATSELAFDAD